MKPKVRIAFVGGFVASALAACAQGEVLGFSSGGFSAAQPPSFTGTKGTSYYNGGNGPFIAITQLGVFDKDGDGMANAHQIGLWAINGTLLASGTVQAGTTAQLVDGYRYVSISQVVIPIGYLAQSAFIIAANYTTGDADDIARPLVGQYARGITPYNLGIASYALYGLGEGLPFPNLHVPPLTEGSVVSPFYEVNFQFKVIPEPASWQFVGTGLFLMLLRRRSIR